MTSRRVIQNTVNKILIFKTHDHNEHKHENTSLHQCPHEKYATDKETTHLKFKLGAAEVGPLLLPEVVWLDNEGYVDAGRERLLEDLQ